jgi:hypothetical protein
LRSMESKLLEELKKKIGDAWDDDMAEKLKLYVEGERTGLKSAASSGQPGLESAKVRQNELDSAISGNEQFKPSFEILQTLERPNISQSMVGVRDKSPV